MMWLVAVACIVGCVLPFVISHLRGHRPIAPRRLAKFLSLLLPSMAILAFAVAIMPVLLLGQRPEMVNWVELGFGCWMLVTWWWFLDRRPTDEEAQVNYYVEPHRCGRCGYDLTGNASGVCPECGWKLPPEPSLGVDPTWGMFWKQWEISWMDRPGKRLGICLGATGVSIAMGLLPLILVKRLPPPVIVFCIVFLLPAGFGLINSWRIISFMRRSCAGHGSTLQQLQDTAPRDRPQG